MAIDYVDAGQAIDNSTLSSLVGSAPPVAKNLTYERILDARNGDLLWQYRHAIPFDVSLCCGNVNRGVAVAQGMVFVVTLNAHIVALDAATGKKVWDQPYGDVRAGESATVAPLVVKDMVIVGSSGGEFGSRGHTDAFKLETGERVWRTYMIPKPGEPGSETWPEDGDQWQRGGANCWVTPTYDPELNLLYYGTGNPCPDFDGGVREGDNLYTDSGVAVDVDTGEIKAHFQYTPHDLWDYDSTMEHILFDLDGQKLAAHFDKNGFMYILDRTDMSAVRVAPFVFPDKEGDPVHFWPGPAGAKEWTHACYSPQTELLYCPVQDIGATATRRRREFKESIPYWGAGVAVDAEDIAGSISAFDPRTGAERWRWKRDLPMCSSLLTTAGGLVFGGEPTGEFNALDAETGDHLWKFQCGSGHHSSPSTYSVDGKQYIVAASGWGGWAEGFLPMMLGSSHGDALFAFALPDF